MAATLLNRPVLRRRGALCSRRASASARRARRLCALASRRRTRDGAQARRKASGDGEAVFDCRRSSGRGAAFAARRHALPRALETPAAMRLRGGRFRRCREDDTAVRRAHARYNICERGSTPCPPSQRRPL